MTPALEYRDCFLAKIFPRLCELQAQGENIFGASSENLLSILSFFFFWQGVLSKNFVRPITNGPAFFQKKLTKLAYYQENFIVNLVDDLWNIIRGLIESLPVVRGEPSVGVAKPLDELARSFFQQAILPTTSCKETKNVSVKGRATLKSTRKKRAKKPVPILPKEEGRTPTVEVLFIAPLYSSTLRKIEYIDIENITPNRFHHLAHSIYQISLSNPADYNPLPLRLVAHCVQQMASLYGLISQNKTKGINFFTLYGITLEESARAVEQFFDAHFKEVPSTHDLNVLAASLFSGEAFPKIIQKIHLGTYWYRYFFEENANFARRLTFLSSAAETPKVLLQLIELAQGTKQVDAGSIKKKMIKILKGTAHFLSANLPLKSEDLEQIPLIKFPQLNFRFDQERAQILAHRCRTHLPLIHDEIANQKTEQLAIHFSSLKDIFMGCRRAKEFSTYAFWANRLLWQVQHLVSESLTLLIYLKKGVVETYHEVAFLAEKTNLEFTGEDLAPFAGLSTKARYPAKNQAEGDGGELIDALEVLLRYPEINSDFVINPHGNDPWDHLPTKGVKIEQINQNLVRFTNHAIKLLSEKIFPALFPEVV